MPAIRSLIESITLRPKKEGRGVDIEVVGRLNNVIALATGKPLEIDMAPAPMMQMVAEEGKSCDLKY